MGKLVGIAGRNQKSSVAIDDDFVNRADVGRHDGPADAHRFQDRDWVGFHVRREGEHVHRREEAGHIGAGAEEDVARRYPSSARAAQAIRGMDRRRRSGTAQLAISLEPGGHFQKQLVIFFRPQCGDDPENRIGRADTQVACESRRRREWVRSAAYRRRLE